MIYFDNLIINNLVDFININSYVNLLFISNEINILYKCLDKNIYNNLLKYEFYNYPEWILDSFNLELLLKIKTAENQNINKGVIDDEKKFISFNFTKKMYDNNLLIESTKNYLKLIFSLKYKKCKIIHEIEDLDKFKHIIYYSYVDKFDKNIIINLFNKKFYLYKNENLIEYYYL